MSKSERVSSSQGRRLKGGRRGRGHVQRRAPTRGAREPLPGTAGADFVTPGRTRGQDGLLGSAGGRDQAGQTGGAPGRGAGRGVSPGRSGARVVRPPAIPDAGVAARAGRGRALSPTASVMKDTWMKSDSQLSTYMNHMAPAPRPARPPDRRDGPARSGSGYTEPPPPLPRPRPADARAPPPRGAGRERRPLPGPD